MSDESGSVSAIPQQFAFMEWQKRWNNAEAVTSLYQNGSMVWLTTVMGTIMIDLEDTESINAYSQHMMTAINLLLDTKKEYEDVKSEFS
jgi:hypothetical protein